MDDKPDRTRTDINDGLQFDRYAEVTVDDVTARRPLSYWAGPMFQVKPLGWDGEKWHSRPDFEVDEEKWLRTGAIEPRELAW